MTRPIRPGLRYYGAKWRLAPWIMSFFPKHQCYVEPFAGGGSVILQKDPSTSEVYNDLDQDVVNFFCVLRDHEDELLRLLELTPFARAELELARKPTDDPIERARRTFIRALASNADPQPLGGEQDGDTTAPLTVAAPLSTTGPISTTSGVSLPDFEKFRSSATPRSRSSFDSMLLQPSSTATHRTSRAPGRDAGRIAPTTTR